jgi:dGTPase
VRVVELLENDGKGLNLTWEVRDGILNHKTSGHPATLEGNVVRLSDKIAYINHDIDDAIRAGIFEENQIPKIYTSILGNSTRERLNTLIKDIITNSRGKDGIFMSDEVGDAMTSLRQYMFSNLYTNPTAKSEETKAYKLITELYNYYMENPDTLPENYRQFVEDGQQIERVICDYISGMTDQYCVSKFTEIFVPKSWKG